MIEHVRGKLAVLYATFTSGGEIADPSELNIAIYYKGDTIIELTSMIKISTGFYYYSFNIPNTWEIDVYAAIYTGVLGGAAFQQSEPFNVIKETIISGDEEETNTYCSSVNVESELAGVNYSNIPSVETLIVNYIPWAEQEINRRTSRCFKPITETLYLDGVNSPQLVLPHHPITSVSSCIIDERYSFQNIALINTFDKKIGAEVVGQSGDTEIEVADLLVDCASGVLIIPQKNINMNVIDNQQLVGTACGRNIFIEGIRNIKVACVHGYPLNLIPKDIRNACAKLVAIKILQKHSDETGKGANSLSVDGFSKSWGGSGGGRPYSDRIVELNLDIDRILLSYAELGIN